MRTQENKEKYKEYDHKYYIKNKRPKTKIGQAEAEIEQLKQQLAEKDCRIEELEGQFAYECECNMQLVDLQKQLEEKQKTIDEINKEFVQAVHDWKALCAEKDKEISKLQASCQQVKTQLAIQELAEVERLLYESHYKEIDNRYYAEYEDIKNLIDSRIKALEKRDV